MAKVTLTPHGIKAARAAGMNRNPPKRGPSKGWTASAARRNRDFLKSIDPIGLTGHAVSASLTLGRDARITPPDMQRLRTAFFHRLRREGVIRHHWVMEFQRDGTPHLHMMIFAPETISPEHAVAAVTFHWLEVMAHTGSASRGQHVVPVHSLTGWLQYLAKHGARGAQHYQRSTPEGWEKPGRMWGKSGDWPTMEEAFEVDASTFYALRRWVLNWRLADCRKDLRRARLWNDAPSEKKALRRIKYAKKVLKRGTRQRSELMGFDEWAGPHVVIPMIDVLTSRPGGWLIDWDQRDEQQSPPAPQTPNIEGVGGRDYER